MKKFRRHIGVVFLYIMVQLKYVPICKENVSTAKYEERDI